MVEKLPVNLPHEEFIIDALFCSYRSNVQGAIYALEKATADIEKRKDSELKAIGTGLTIHKDSYIFILQLYIAFLGLRLYIFYKKLPELSGKKPNILTRVFVSKFSKKVQRSKWGTNVMQKSILNWALWGMGLKAVPQIFIRLLQSEQKNVRDLSSTIEKVSSLLDEQYTIFANKTSAEHFDYHWKAHYCAILTMFCSFDLKNSDNYAKFFGYYGKSKAFLEKCTSNGCASLLCTSFRVDFMNYVAGQLLRAGNITKAESINRKIFALCENSQYRTHGLILFRKGVSKGIEAEIEKITGSFSEVERLCNEALDLCYQGLGHCSVYHGIINTILAIEYAHANAEAFMLNKSKNTKTRNEYKRYLEKAQTSWQQLKELNSSNDENIRYQIFLCIKACLTYSVQGKRTNMVKFKEEYRSTLHRLCSMSHISNELMSIEHIQGGLKMLWQNQDYTECREVVNNFLSESPKMNEAFKLLLSGIAALSALESYNNTSKNDLIDPAHPSYHILKSAEDSLLKLNELRYSRGKEWVNIGKETLRKVYNNEGMWRKFLSRLDCSSGFIFTQLHPGISSHPSSISELSTISIDTISLQVVLFFIHQKNLKCAEGIQSALKYELIGSLRLDPEQIIEVAPRSFQDYMQEIDAKAIGKINSIFLFQIVENWEAEPGGAVKLADRLLDHIKFLQAPFIWAIFDIHIIEGKQGVHANQTQTSNFIEVDNYIDQSNETRETDSLASLNETTAKYKDEFFLHNTNRVYQTCIQRWNSMDAQRLNPSPFIMALSTSLQSLKSVLLIDDIFREVDSSLKNQGQHSDHYMQYDWTKRFFLFHS